jgi:hypothetical protein
MMWIKLIDGRFQEIEVVDPPVLVRPHPSNWDEDEDVPEDFPIPFDGPDGGEIEDWRMAVPEFEMAWLDTDLEDVPVVSTGVAYEEVDF